MVFTSEAEFEQALIQVLTTKGWEKEILRNYTEADFIQNWANILFENNRSIERLNNQPLTEGEMQQILEQVKEARTPLKLNGFINGKTIMIKRDNPDDTLHYGKEISLKIYDRREIAAGQSRYQIAQQPKFFRKSKVEHDRRGDLMLLINGMPVIHIELKRSGTSVSEATRQIKLYSDEGVFTGIFSLVQIFVAMNPEETKYYANPGPGGKFMEQYYFHWADFNNEPVNDWKEIAAKLLSIPMAHQLIGFYTVADGSDGILKVMRSYQYYAASAISDRVSKIKWDDNGWNEHNQRGGYIWHTTGSGKTMTSFKSAQLIANSDDADKVVFLTDRVELGTQSLLEYRNYKADDEDVQATENTYVLISKLTSNAKADTLIVTSIQKLSNIEDEAGMVNAHDLEKIRKKRIVIIVDEAHRSTFGEMLQKIKKTFPKAVLFGFTGTPIHDENQKKDNTTADVFGNELHRYSIADGIRDSNVLGFDTYKVMTFKDSDVRRAVALEQAKASSEEEVFGDPAKEAIYDKFMDSDKVKMAGYMEVDASSESGKVYVRGIEDYLPNSQYETEEHQNKVVEDIASKWVQLSRGGKFHAMFATSSIAEAIQYYRLFKKQAPHLKVTCLFDPHTDLKTDTEKGDSTSRIGYMKLKEEGLTEIIEDYNARYEQHFDKGSHAAMKKDMAARLAHKDNYKMLERTPEKYIDILIVVDQMLTGFDSKWLNTLYVDKLMRYESIIQAFSRTNRLFGSDKPFGTIRYYRRPHTMERNINDAIKLYSGDKPFGMFAEKLEFNLQKLNEIFHVIETLFQNAGEGDFQHLPEETEIKAKFASLFNEFNRYLEAAKVQGFKWEDVEYVLEADERTILMEFDETEYLTLLQRYQELGKKERTDTKEAVPYDLKGYLTEVDIPKINAEYMNSTFTKYLKLLKLDGVEAELIEQALNELHKTFATLSQEEQKFANIFLHDVQRGDVIVEEGLTLRDYITRYMHDAKNDQIHRLAVYFGLNEALLREMMNDNVNEKNRNEFGRFEALKQSVKIEKAIKFFELTEGKTTSGGRAKMKVDKLLSEFICSGGFELPEVDIKVSFEYGEPTDYTMMVAEE